MSDQLFYIIFTPIVIGLFVFAFIAEKGFQKSKSRAKKQLREE